MKILFVDTETCGFLNDRYPDEHPAQPPLVQLGCLLVDADNGAEFATLELIVRPDGYIIPSQAASVHGITTPLAEAFGVPLSLVIPAYVQLRNRADAVAAFNAPYDLAIMRAAIARNGRPATLPGPSEIIDVAALATPIVKMPATERMRNSKLKVGEFKTPKLEEAYTFFFGAIDYKAHGALADARAAARVWFEIKNRENAKNAEEIVGEVGREIV